MATAAVTPINMSHARNQRKAWYYFAAAPCFIGMLMQSFSLAVAPLGAMSTAVLICLLSVSVYTDLTCRRIPNWVTYPSFAWALGLGLLQTLTGNTDWFGQISLTASLSGGFGLLFFMFVLFSITGGGAGDVKLTACLGALLGWHLAVETVLISYLVGGTLLLGWTIMALGPIRLLTSLCRCLAMLFAPQSVNPPDLPTRRLFKRKVPLAGFFAIGCFLVLAGNAWLS